MYGFCISLRAHRGRVAPKGDPGLCRSLGAVFSICAQSELVDAGAVAVFPLKRGRVFHLHQLTSDVRLNKLHSHLGWPR